MTAHTAPSVTTTTANDVLVASFTADNAATWTSGDTELADGAATVSGSMYHSASVTKGRPAHSPGEY